MIELVLHCHGAGRSSFTPTIKRCIEYARGHDDVLFARRRELADWTLEQQEAKVQQAPAARQAQEAPLVL